MVRTWPVIVFLIFVMCSAQAISSRGQIAGGLDETERTFLGGHNYIVGTVFDPDGFPVKVRTPIRLSSLTQKEVLSSTDDQGKFIFSGLPNGTYTISVEATNEYQTAIQTVDIELSRGTPPQSFAVSLRLQTKPRASTRPGVVSAETAGIPKRALEHYRKAQSLSDAGDAKGAVMELQAAIKEYPDFAAALTALGIQQLKTGDLDLADVSFQKALAIKPDSFEATVNRGICLFRGSKFAEAESQLRASIKLKGDSDVAHFYLGRTLLAQNSLDDAEKELTAALDLSKGSLVEAYRMLVQLYIQRDDFKRAIKALDTYLAAKPNPADLDQLRHTHLQLEKAMAAVESQRKP